MKYKDIIKAIPFIGGKIKRLKPSQRDILLEIFNSQDVLLIIDVGANIGQTISSYRSFLPNSDIYSFEPTPHIFRKLENKYNNFKGIYLFEFALGDENTIKKFNISEYSPTNSILKANYKLYQKFNDNLYNTLRKSKEIDVKMMKFDDWYENNIKNKFIDIFKIDTQGYEYNVISGAINSLKNKTKLLLFEIQFLPFYEKQIPFYKIFELLYENGFYIYSLLPSSKKGNYQLLESEVIFLNRRFFEFS